MNKTMAVIMAVVAMTVLAASASAVVYDDFETGAVEPTKWYVDTVASDGVVEISTAYAHTGLDSLRLVPNGTSGVAQMFSTNLSTFINGSGRTVVSLWLFTDGNIASLTDPNNLTATFGLFDQFIGDATPGAGPIAYWVANPDVEVFGGQNGYWTDSLNQIDALNLPVDSGQDDLVQTWMNVRVLIDFVNDTFTIRFGNATEDEAVYALNANPVADIFFGATRNSASYDGGVSLYVDDVEAWDYDTFGWNNTAPCTPNWSCSGFDTCNASNVEPCLAVDDLNACGEAFSGSLADYDGACVYVPPAEPQATGRNPLAIGGGSGTSKVAAAQTPTAQVVASQEGTNGLAEFFTNLWNTIKGWFG